MGNPCDKQVLQLNDQLFAYCSIEWTISEMPRRIYLCLILLDIAIGTFEFCDAAVLHEKSFGWFGCTIINSDNCEQPQIQVKFVAKNRESTTNEWV
jgi:hypothetical protein